MQLKIITHERIVFDGDVDELIIQTKAGQMGILKDHIPLTTTLDVGVTKARQGDKFKYFATIFSDLNFWLKKFSEKECPRGYPIRPYSFSGCFSILFKIIIQK